MGINLGSIFKGAAHVGGGLLSGGLPGAIIGGLGLFQGAKDQSRGNKLQQQALDLAHQQWLAGAPQRARAQQLAAQPLPTAPNLSRLFTSDNPYSTGRSMR